MGIFGPPDIKKLKARKNVKGLIKALKDKDEDVRRDSAEALGKIRDKRAVEPLIEALKDKDEGVRKDSAEALGKIGDPSAVEPLIGALKDVDPYVRKAALDALKKIAKQAKVNESLRQSAIDAVKQVDIDRLNMELDGFCTSNPDKAVEMLFDKAMAVVPTLSQKKFVKACDRNRQAWGPLPLVEGSESELKRVILDNAKALARKHGFKGFTIFLFPEKEAAQMGARIDVRELPADGGFAYSPHQLASPVKEIMLLVHMWKTDSAFHAYGRPELLSSKGTVKATRKKTKKQPAADLEGRAINFESLDSFKELIRSKYNLSTNEFDGTIEPETLIGILEQIEENISIYWSIAKETVKEVGRGSVFSSQAHLIVFPKGSPKDELCDNILFVGLAKFHNKKHLDYFLKSTPHDKADMGIGDDLIVSRFIFDMIDDNYQDQETLSWEGITEPITVNDLKKLVAERKVELGLR